MSENAEGRPQGESGPRTASQQDVTSSVPDVRRLEPVRAHRVQKYTLARHVWAHCPDCGRSWSHEHASLDAVNHADELGHDVFVHYGTATVYAPTSWWRDELQKRGARW